MPDIVHLARDGGSSLVVFLALGALIAMALAALDSLPAAPRPSGRSGVGWFGRVLLFAVVLRLLSLAVLVVDSRTLQPGRAGLIDAAQEAPLARLLFGTLFFLAGIVLLAAANALVRRLGSADAMAAEAVAVRGGALRLKRLPPDTVAEEIPRAEGQPSSGAAPSERSARASARPLFAGMAPAASSDVLLTRSRWGTEVLTFLCTDEHRLPVRIGLNLKMSRFLVYDCMAACRSLLPRAGTLTRERLGEALRPPVERGVAGWAGGAGGLDACVRDALASDSRWSGFEAAVRVVKAPGAAPGSAFEVLGPAVAVDGLDYPLEMDRFPVTCGEYYEYLKDLDEGERARRTPATWDAQCERERVDHPVVGVSWDDACAYASRLGKRLPTVEEWERAAGGQARGYPWGGGFDHGARCNCQVNAGVDRTEYPETTPVSMFLDGKSPSGCCDMAGNVLEWCRDEVAGGMRALKGGSFVLWSRAETDVMIGTNYSKKPDERGNYMGFRCCRPGPGL